MYAQGRSNIDVWGNALLIKNLKITACKRNSYRNKWVSSSSVNKSYTSKGK